MKTKSLLKRYAEALTETLLPRKECSAIVERCNNSEILRNIAPTQYKGHTTLLPYRNQTIKTFIRAIKYERHRKSIRLATEILWNYIGDEIAEQEAVQKTRYLLCTVPETQERKEKNGYDHLQEILNELSKKIPQTAEHIQNKKDMLKWKRPVSRQSQLANRSQRLENVATAMIVTEKIQPDTICFIMDDVTTTGATLSEAARALTEADAKTVITLALAH